MTMDRPRRGSRQAQSDERSTGKARNEQPSRDETWRGHEPQWFKDQDERAERQRDDKPVEEHTHMQGHHWQAARSGHDEASARGYGGRPRAATAMAGARRIEVMDDDGREGGEREMRDDRDDEDKGPDDEEATKQTRARRGDDKSMADGKATDNRRKVARAAGDEDEEEDDADDSDSDDDSDEEESDTLQTKAKAKPAGGRKTAARAKVSAGARSKSKAKGTRTAAAKKSAAKRSTKAAGAKRKTASKSAWWRRQEARYGEACRKEGGEQEHGASQGQSSRQSQAQDQGERRSPRKRSQGLDGEAAVAPDPNPPHSRGGVRQEIGRRDLTAQPRVPSSK
jgi:hypothetical protein